MGGVLAKSFLFGLLALGLGSFETRAFAQDVAKETTDHELEEPQKVGVVKKISGKAWASRDASGVRKTELRENDQLFDGDFLITGEKSELVVVLGQKESAILVKQNTVMKVVYNQEKSWLLDLKKGYSLFNVNSKNIRPGFFKVKTNAAVMGVRGTAFFVKSIPGQDVFLCACVGTVAVDDEVVFTSKHHDFHKFIKRGPGKVEKRMIQADQGTDHSDTEAVLLISLLQDEKTEAPKQSSSTN